MTIRAIFACAALFSAAAAPSAYDFYVKVKAAAQEGRSGPVYLFVEADRAAGGTLAREGLIRLTCIDGTLRQSAAYWGAGARKMMGAPKIGEATAVTGIGLPKITPKIAKESHGRMAAPSAGWEPVEFADPAAACASAAGALRQINRPRSNVRG